MCDSSMGYCRQIKLVYYRLNKNNTVYFITVVV